MDKKDFFMNEAIKQAKKAFDILEVPVGAVIVKDNKKFIRFFLKERQRALGLSSKQINEALGVKSNGGGMWSIYTGENICKQFPTKIVWEKLSRILHFQLNYEKIAQTYNSQMGYTDVWRDIDFYSEKRYHPTQKPIALIRRIIYASSNEGDIVLDPFTGCGSTQLAAIGLKRNFLGFEIDENYFRIAKERIIRAQNTLFNSDDNDFFAE